MKKQYVFILLVLSSFFATLQAQTTRYVKEGGAGTKDGLSWANASDDIQLMINNSAANDAVWVAKGTYKPNRPANDLTTIDANNRDNAFVLKKDVQLYGGFAGTETLLTDRDLSLTVNKTILSGDIGTVDVNTDNTYHVVISINDVGNARLDGFTVTLGFANVNGSLSVNTRYLSKAYGGGMYNYSSSPTIINSTFSGNTTTFDGSGMYNYSSSPTIINSTFSGNISARNGGGMSNDSASSPAISNSTFSENTATDDGGGMSNDSSSSPAISNSAFSGNTATGDGGGMYNHSGSSPAIINSIFSGNTASSYGGGMYNDGSYSLTITNSTFIGNTATILGNEYFSNDTTLEVYNTIIIGTITEFTSNIYKNSIIADKSYDNTGAATTTNLTATDLFKDPTNGNFSLKTGSVAINTGSNTLYTDAGGNVTTDKDLAGNPRVAETTIDIGAYEFLPTSPDANNVLYVNKNATGNATGNSWANAIPELADALVWANKNKANFTTTPLQIWVAKGTYKPMYSPEDGANFGTNQNKSNAFLMVNNVQIYGGFASTETTLTERDLSITANKTILSGDLNSDDTITGFGSTLGITNNTDNVYNMVISAGNVGSALLDGFTITGGNAAFNTKFLANTKQIYICSGAGIYNSESNPTYKNLIIRGNLSAESGGGMFSYMSTPKLENILIESNQAKDGGGLTNQGNTSTALTNVTVLGNKSTTTTSGGIYNTDATAILNNSIIWNIIENVGTGSYTAKNSIVKGSSDTANGNIDATGITETTLFKDPTNGDYSLNPSILNTAINAGDNTLYTGTIATDKDVAGNARLFDGVAITDTIDLGAYELQQEPIPLAPKTAISLQIYAGVKTVSDLEVTGTAIKWYDAATAGNFLENTTVLADNTTYYASQTVNGVESTERIAVKTKKISEANQTFLSSANPTVTNLVATPTTNATVKWFTTATKGTALENTATLTTGTYYVEQTSPLLTIETLGSNFSQPFGIALQSDGKILVADTNNNVIKRMDADGTNIQILGSGFNKPRGVALQSDGKILVADAGNNSIKRMDADGSNIVILNSTFNQPHGVALQSDGKILVADSYNSAIKRMDADGSNIQVLGSGFSYPYGITVQSDGKILVADAENGVVKRMAADGSNIQILGTGFSAPSGVALQSDGKILVAGSGSNPIKRMDADGTNIVTLGGGFNISRGVAMQSDGKILVADTFNNAIKRITEVATSNRIAVAVVIIPPAPITSYATQVYAGDSKTLATLEITGTAIKWYDAQTAGNFLENTTALTDNSTYYASQTVNGVESTDRLAVTTKKISEASQTFNASDKPTVANLVATPTTGTTVKWFTTATGGTALTNTDALSSGTYYVEQNTPLTIVTLGSGFSRPFGVAVQADGKILIADTSNNAIKRMNADGSNIELLGSGFSNPIAVVVESDGKILVADSGNNVIKRMDADGTNIVNLGSGFNQPYDVAVQPDGKILVADAGNKTIKRMDADGTNIQTLGSGFSYPYGVSIQSDGKILIADTLNNAIKRMDADGTNIQTLGSGFSSPSKVITQSDGKILVADAGNNAIKRMDADGTNIEILGSGFYDPTGIAFQSDGKILVADRLHNAIKRITEATISNRVAVSVVVKATPIISFADFTKTYGDTAFDLTATSTSSETVTYSVVAGGTGEVNLSGKNITLVNAGTVTLKASVAENATYEAAEKTITLTINKAELTVTADNKSRMYGDANPTFTFAYSGFKNSDDASDLTAPLTTSTTATQTSNVGDYDIVVSFNYSKSAGAPDNYSYKFVKGTLAITKAELSVTADNKSRMYGDANPTFTVSYVGFKNSDDASDLTAPLTTSTTATQTSNVGDYDIVVSFNYSKSADAPDNYSYKFVKGTLAITKAELTVTADNKSRMYGDANPTFTFAYSGFKNSDDASDLTAPLTTSTTATQTSNVGDYDILVSFNYSKSADAPDNYSYKFVKGTLAITKAELTVTADNKSRMYGDANPTFTFAYSGFKNSDDASDLTTPLTTSTTATQTSNVGDYDILVSFNYSKSADAPDNYSYKFVKGTLAITKAELTVTADTKSKVYGDANPTFTLSYAGFKNGESATDLTTVPTASTIAILTSDAGTYDIEISGGAATNYTFAYAKGTLSITKASQTITFNAVTHNDKDVFDLIATSTSGLAITYTSSDTNVATISGNTITVVSAGTTTITAIQTGNNNYKAASEVDQVLTIITLGVDDDIVLSEVIKVYPNPAVNFIKLDIGTLEKISIKIFDVTGKLVLDKKNYTTKEVLNISKLKIGVYFVKIESDKGNTMKKFLKKE